MKVRELIIQLSDLDPEAEIITISGPTDEPCPAFGIQERRAVICGEGDTRTVWIEYDQNSKRGGAVTVYEIV